MTTEDNNSFVRTFQEVAQGVLGVPVSFGFSHGATDARYFAEAGVPSLVFGAKGGNFHGQGEWVDLESLENVRQILSEFLKTA